MSVSFANGKRALTLVELLVSIVIVGFLATLLLGATLKVRSRGHDATCLSQLRAHVSAAMQWSHEHNGLFPTNNLRTELYPYLGITSLAERIDTPMTCPAAQSLLPTEHYMHATYGINQFLTSSYEGAVYSWQKVRYFRNVQEPSRIIFFLDGPTDGPNAQGLVYYGATVRPGKTAFFFPHRNGLNLAYVDGHAAWIGKQEFLSPEYQDFASPGNRWGVPSP
ncbi:MAG TPA: prepilin-type N-terminal cleavage/methylation domain-containing protein [Chthoniobacteraceae bacterium]|nr:prepilin-type N-terminal cleavage/methylation domain-containing protein [Chthoniobacteraceae bacterium]